VETDRKAAAHDPLVFGPAMAAEAAHGSRSQFASATRARGVFLDAHEYSHRWHKNSNHVVVVVALPIVKKHFFMNSDKVDFI
jgi:hypothetical protein